MSERMARLLRLLLPLALVAAGGVAVLGLVGMLGGAAKTGDTPRVTLDLGTAPPSVP